MEPTLVVAAALFGLVVGSFLNVVIARMPAEDPADRSLGGRSHCMSCGAQIAWYDNLPVISYLVLRGRCRRCKVRYGPRYVLVELLTGALFAAVALADDDVLVVAIGCLFVAQLVAITFIDLSHRIIPNAITLPGAALGIALWALADTDRLPEILISAIAASGILLVTALIYPAGMGMGDVKMALLMGAYLGREVAIGMFAGFFLGAVVGVAIMLRAGGKGRKTAIPFGPFLAVGSVVAWFWGVPIMDAYLATFDGG